MWTDRHIEKHSQAAASLHAIVQDAFQFIREKKDPAEYEVRRFIEERLRISRLKMDKHHNIPIVGFGPNSALPHYSPKENSRQLEKGDVILIDIWARLDEPAAPFADITWMGFFGKKIPEKVEKIWRHVRRARDGGIETIRRSAAARIYPSGKMIDENVRKIIENEGYGQHFIHGTGHPLGFRSPHGRNKEKGRRGNINRKGVAPLSPLLGYTIEPGIYLPGEFGIRSEIDLYLTNDHEVVITNPLQQEMIMA